MYVQVHSFFLIDGVIYFTDYTHIYAIRLSDGTVLWSYQPGGGSDRIEVVDQIVCVFGRSSMSSLPAVLFMRSMLSTEHNSGVINVAAERETQRRTGHAETGDSDHAE
jgi:PQQ enzyme repeat